MTSFANTKGNTASSKTKSVAITTKSMAISPRQRIAYVVGVQLASWAVAFFATMVVYMISGIGWVVLGVGGIELFAIFVTQFGTEMIEGKKQWSKADWKTVFTSSLTYGFIVALALGPNLLLDYILMVHECADLKGPMQYICTQEGGRQTSAFYSSDHDGDVWNTDTVAWLVFAPLLLAKMFVYDTVYDLFFYWQHRLCHEIPWLYRHIHKEHHTLTHVQKTEDPLMKSWHTVPDWKDLLSLMAMQIPAMVVLSAFGSHPLLRTTGLDMAFIFGYITIEEHLGHVDGPLACEINAMPSVKIFNIIGFPHCAGNYHILHHNVLNCNYSKRLFLWDIIFGTLETPVGGVGKWHKTKFTGEMD